MRERKLISIPKHAVVALILLAGYVGIGLAESWWTRERAETAATAVLVAQQATLSRYKAVNEAINRAISDGMAREPALARIRVAFMQVSATQTNMPTVRWDITHSQTRQGHVVGALRNDLQVSDWSDYFGAVLTHQCTNVNVAAMTPDATLARIREMHIAGFVVCPTVTAKGELIGAVFASWDIGDPVPPDLKATEAVVHEVANRIAAAVMVGR